MEGFTGTQVSTLAVKDNLLVAGGFQGELVCKASISFFDLLFLAGRYNLHVCIPALSE